MSINWVMVNENNGNLPFILLPNEEIKYESPLERTELLIRQVTSIKNKRIINATGKVYLSNHRLVFISAYGDIKSFSVLLNQIKTHKLETPWFIGPTLWKCIFITTSDKVSGLVENENYELQLKFNEGGIFDFTKIFETVHTNYVNDQADELPAYSEF
ncbi:hypothetical protein PACTADRAFT_48243 [Pachysolen tannophilus NRRL Y-2460]|uniref:GRAM domain-containing protein n=1 Tax=Pachysolen tannophilus NRRL Y-2460 TaxID=669874 RepID=A0A1E4U3B1_PACTA|nr:hypothetical protein PACTADRAFT_48243 [Pachysolen tannophilus NRRL Y-2460]